MDRFSGRAREDEGFTLIELLVVVIIIGILAAIAIPVFLNQREKARNAAARSDLRNLITAQEAYLTDKEAYTTSGDALRAQQRSLTQGVEHAVCIESGDADHYIMGTKHVNGDRAYVYDNETGAIVDYEPATEGGGLLDAWPTSAACTPDDEDVF